MLFGVVVIALVFGFKAMKGAKEGEPCVRASDCARLFSGACVTPEGGAGYCSRTCSGQGDCAGGWTCASAQAQVRKVTMSRSVCVRPQTE